MNKFEQIINEYKNKYNYIVAGKIGIGVAMLIICLFQIYNVAFNVTTEHILELFYTALTLRVTGALLIIYQIFANKDKFLTDKGSARLIDRINQDKDDTMLSTLELKNSKENPDNGFLKRIIIAADKKAEETTLIYPRMFNKSYLALIIMFVIGNILIFTIFANNFQDTWSGFYIKAMPKMEQDYTINIAPGDTTIVAGSLLKIEVLNYESDYEYSLKYQTDDKWRTIPLTQASYLFKDVTYSFTYFIEHKKFTTQHYKVNVFDKLTIDKIKVVYEYPKYTKLPTETDTTSFGDVSGIYGTKLNLIVESNNKIKEGVIILNDGNSIEGNIANANTMVFSFKLEKNASYHLKITDVHDDAYFSPDKTISVINDLKPEIVLSDYPEDKKMNKNQLVPITVKVSDDFGLNNLNLYYQVNQGNIIDSLIFTQMDKKVFNFSTIIDLQDIQMFPNDSVTIWSSVEDHYKAKHHVESDKITIKLPTLEEIFRAIEEKEDQQNKILEDNLEESKKLQSEFENKRREVLKKKELDWQDKKELKDIVSQQEKMSEDVKQASDLMEEMIEESRKNEALTKETLEKMERIKELMEEINSEDLQEAMQKMKEKMDDMSDADMKKALDEMKFSMEEFSEKIEQTLKMLEQLKKEQSLEKLSGLSKEMEEMQSELKKESQSSKGNEPSSADKQKSIKEKLEEIEKEADELSEMLNTPNDKQVKDALEQMKQEADMESMKQQMDDVAAQMEQQKGQETVSSQQQMLKKMENMSKSLMSMQGMMGSLQDEELKKAKEKAIAELIYYSQQNISITNTLDKDPFVVIEDIIALHEMVNLSINKFLSTPNAIMMLTPKFIIDYNDTNSAFKEIFIDVNNNVKHKVNKRLGSVQESLHNMIFDLLQEDGNQQSGGGSGSQSMMEQMQQMSQQQMAMNMMSQQLMQQLGKGQKKIPQNMRGQMGKMAGDEKQLADNLERMLKTNPQAQKNARSINKMIDELNDVSRKLRFNKMDKSLLKQQENILSRMLDATKSINKRDKSKKRKAEEGKQKIWETPEDISLRFKEIEKNAILEEAYKNYPKEYQKIILEYIKKLNKEN